MAKGDTDLNQHKAMAMGKPLMKKSGGAVAKPPMKKGGGMKKGGKC